MRKLHTCSLAFLLLFVMIAGVQAGDSNNDYYDGLTEVLVSATTTQSTVTFTDEAYYILVRNDAASANACGFAVGNMVSSTGAYATHTVQTSQPGSETIYLGIGEYVILPIHTKYLYIKSAGTSTIRVTALHKKQIP